MVARDGKKLPCKIRGLGVGGAVQTHKHAGRHAASTTRLLQHKAANFGFRGREPYSGHEPVEQRVEFVGHIVVIQRGGV